jgi:hypothetical protein
MDNTDGVLRIESNTRDNRGAFTRDKTAVETLPAGSVVDDLIDRMIAILQQAATEQAE